MTARIRMTEAEAMEKLVGRMVRVTLPTHSGSEEILGSVTTPLMIEETEMGEVITHASIEGMVVAERVTGLPLPIEEERSIRIELLPVSKLELL